MIPIRTVLSLSVLLLLTVGAAQAATWTTIDVPGSKATQVFGINGFGDMVGDYTDAAGTLHGFLLKGGVLTNIDVPGSVATQAIGINQDGQIAGFFYDSQWVGHGFFFDGHNFTILDFPGAVLTFGNGLDGWDNIVGGYIDSQGQSHGFKWSSGSFVTIDVPHAVGTTAFGLSDEGVISGTYQTLNGSTYVNHGFVLNRRQGTFRRFGTKLNANGINDVKVVVGFSGHYGYRFSLKSNLFRKMRYPGAFRTRCFGISNNLVGEIVGDYVGADRTLHGFLWVK